METIAANSVEGNEFNEIVKLVSKEIDNFKDLLEKIVVEWASYYLVNEFGISHDSSTFLARSFQSLLWSYFFERNYYDIGRSGRFKLNHKLSLAGRIFQKVLAQDVKDFDGNVLFAKGTFMSREKVALFAELSRSGKLDIVKKFSVDYLPENFPNLDSYSDFEVEEILIYKTRSSSLSVVRLLGVPQSCPIDPTVRFGDFFSIVSYISNLGDEIGHYDDIDHLGNKRLKLVNELLQSRVLVAMSRIARFAEERMNNMEAKINYSALKDSAGTDFSVKSILNTKPFQMVIKEFFNSHQLTQFLDQQNPLSELTNKRKISAMGPGGIKREDPNLNIRDVHYSHYGKICPIETPEGINIGLIMALSFFAQIDEFGFLVTPYYKVVDGKVTEDFH